ncbi:MAG: hypothetical protein NVS3B1_17620 [Marmoricola sp.]
MSFDQIIPITTPRCPHCGLRGSVLASAAGVLAWQQGALIQSALPEVPIEQREQIKSGFHPACWRVVFGDEE